MSKGDKRRPQLVSNEVLTRNWNLAFKRGKNICQICGGLLTKDGHCESLLRQQMERT